MHRMPSKITVTNQRQFGCAWLCWQQIAAQHNILVARTHANTYLSLSLSLPAAKVENTIATSVWAVPRNCQGTSMATALETLLNALSQPTLLRISQCWPASALAFSIFFFVLIGVAIAFSRRAYNDFSGVPNHKLTSCGYCSSYSSSIVINTKLNTSWANKWTFGARLRQHNSANKATQCYSW